MTEIILMLAVWLLFAAVYLQQRRESMTRERVRGAIEAARIETLESAKRSGRECEEHAALLALGAELHHINVMAALGYGVPPKEQVEARMVGAAEIGFKNPTCKVETRPVTPGRRTS